MTGYDIEGELRAEVDRLRGEVAHFRNRASWADHYKAAAEAANAEVAHTRKVLADHNATIHEAWTVRAEHIKNKAAIEAIRALCAEAELSDALVRYPARVDVRLVRAVLDAAMGGGAA